MLAIKIVVMFLSLRGSLQQKTTETTARGERAVLRISDSQIDELVNNSYLLISEGVDVKFLQRSSNLTRACDVYSTDTDIRDICENTAETLKNQTYHAYTRSIIF